MSSISRPSFYSSSELPPEEQRCVHGLQHLYNIGNYGDANFILSHPHDNTSYHTTPANEEKFNTAKSSLPNFDNNVADCISQNMLPPGTPDLNEKATTRYSSKPAFKALLWPAFAICVPIALLSATLLTIVLAYQVKPIASLFNPSTRSRNHQEQSHILVDFSATQIVFLASFLSTVAPLLAGCIMSLTSVLICRDLRASSDTGKFSMLPSPYQMSLLVGILAASYAQLLSSTSYLLSRKRSTKAPPVLLYSVAILILSIFLGVAVTITDAVLHYVTQTISFDLYSVASTPNLEHGRGLNSLCAGFDRMKENHGYACSQQVFEGFDDPNFFTEQAEIQYLMHNTSHLSEIRHGLLEDKDETEIAFLNPKSANLSAGTDFQAVTFGVSAKCQLIPPSECNLTSWGPDGDIYASFNCSPNFWGTLGMNPNFSETNAVRYPSEYISFLGVKPWSNLQYNFFTDASMETIYNPAGLNDSNVQDPNFNITQDKDLANPIYMGFAWRSSINAFAGGDDHEMATSPKANYNLDENWINYFLSCEVTTYAVDYVWFKSMIQSVTATPHSNGTWINLWHGLTNYGPSIAGGGNTYQDYNFQAAVAGNTTDSYERKFGSLLSEQVVASIGGYSSGRTVVQQQNRQTLLLAQIPKAALGSLIACSLIYPVLGSVLLFKAYKSSCHYPSIKNLFSLWGIAAAAWHDDRDERRHSAVVTPDEIKSCGHEENTRLFVRGDSENGYRFGIWKKAVSGNVVEIQRSQSDITTFI